MSGSAAARAAIDAALAAASRAGAELEVAVLEARGDEVWSGTGAGLTRVRRDERGVAVRAWSDHRPGFASTTSLAPHDVVSAVDAACALASHAAPDRRHGPAEADGGRATTRPWQVDDAFDDAPARAKDALVRALEAAARAAGPGVDRLRRALYRDVRETWTVATTRGVAVCATRTRAALSIDVAASAGTDRRTGSAAGWAPGPRLLDPERVGRAAGARALAQLGARPGRSGRVPVVLDREASAGLLEALSGAFSGLRVLRGRSALGPRLGRAIGTGAVTLVDDPTLSGAWDATPYDGEGRPTRRAILIEDGVLRGFLHDGYTARHLGAVAGHALRGGCTAPPAIGARALHLLPTGSSRDELLRHAAGGLFVTGLLGLHTVDLASGEFSLGAYGHELEADGSVGRPVDGIAVSGTVLELLGAIEAVADDVECPPQAALGATVLLRELAVSGR